MKGKCLFVFCVIFCLAYGCRHGSVEPKRDIVLVFDAEELYQERLYYTDDKETGPYMMDANPVIFTVRNALRADSSKIIKTVNSDTLTIENDADRLFIHYEYNPLESFDFIVNAGDTVLIEKVDGTPYLTVINRPGAVSVNYDRDRKTRFGEVHGYSPEILESFPSMLGFICWTKGLDRKSEKERVHDLALSSLEYESECLDSLYEAGTMDELEHSFFKERNRYRRLDFDLDHLSRESLSGILEGYSDSLYRADVFMFYRKYMNEVVNKLYFTDYIRHAQGSEPDYPKTFDKISGDALLHGLLKDDNLYVCHKNIADTRSHAEAKLYYEKLLGTVEDEDLLAAAVREYGEKFSMTIEVKDDLELLSSQGDTLMFKDLREELLGKVLYVDIWASWCEPCKREMPHSHKLAQEYSGEDVVFVYIALNDTKDKWEKAAEKLGLNEIGKSFLVLNSKENTWTKQMNVNTIPRYMIYDRKGKLVNTNAPRPSSENIREELERL